MRFRSVAAHTLKLTVPHAALETVSGSEVINGAQQSYTVFFSQCRVIRDSNDDPANHCGRDLMFPTGSALAAVT